MVIRFELMNHGKVPSKAYQYDAGWDLYARSSTVRLYNNTVVYDLGVAVEIPPGYVGLLFPRSSISKTPLMMKNSVGVIDSGYRGEIKAVFQYNPDEPIPNNIGKAVAQLVIMPIVNTILIQVNKLSPSERGEKGFGSSNENGG